MTAPRSIQCCIAGALLLQACAAPKTSNALMVQPTLQVRHGTSETADAYYELGRHHQSQGNLELALSGYNYAIARDARHLDARIAAAAIHAGQGRLDQARAMMLAVVADYPDASQAHNNLGYVEYLRGEHAAAARSMRRALTLDRRNERARNNLLLVENALAAAAPALPAAPEAPIAVQAVPLPAPVAMAQAEPVPPRMELVRLDPNVYELKMPKTVTAPVPQAMPPAAPLARARVEVSNADGTPGLARKVGTLLGKQGMPVARLTNQRPYGQQATRIQYRPSHAAQAEALRKFIDGPVVMTASMPAGAYADVRLVLGRDTQRAMALRETADTELTVAAR
jgi:Flp pilus assembly protein TadD